jgi:hypothetical protein
MGMKLLGFFTVRWIFYDTKFLGQLKVGEIETSSIHPGAFASKKFRYRC